MKKNLMMLISILLVCGCSNKQKEVKPVITISIDKLDPFQSILDSSIVQNVIHIPLEQTNDCLIGNIDKILFFKDKFYVFDMTVTKAILVFGKSGNFLFKISKLGKGPGEYIEPRDFNLDSDGNIYLWDNGQQKLIKYSDNGTKFQEYKIKIRFWEFSLLDNNRILVHDVLPPNDANIGVYDITKNKLDIILAKRNIFDDIDVLRFSSNYLYSSNHTIYFSPRFTNGIYKIGKDAVMQEFLKINTEMPFATKEFISDTKNNKLLLGSDNKYIKDITDIYETSDFITFKIHCQFSYRLLFSKATKKKILFLVTEDKNYLVNYSVYGTADGKFISYIRPYENKKDWIEALNKSKLSENTKNKLKSLGPDTPIITLAELKKF